MHQNRVTVVTDLYRQARTERSGARSARAKIFQAAAVLRLGRPGLTEAQVSYAAADVTHLHALKDKLDAMLAREGREALAAACFRFLPDRVRLDLAGFAADDIFAHS